jgi:hypothetical protein
MTVMLQLHDFYSFHSRATLGDKKRFFNLNSAQTVREHLMERPRIPMLFYQSVPHY